MIQNDDSLVKMILTLIRKNDNSINPNDDTYYKASLLKIILKC